MKDDAIVFWVGVGVGAAFGIRLAERLQKKPALSDQDRRKQELRVLRRRVEKQEHAWARTRAGT